MDAECGHFDLQCFRLLLLYDNMKIDFYVFLFPVSISNVGLFVENVA